MTNFLLRENQTFIIFGCLFLSHIAASQFNIPAYIQLIANSVVLVYLGCIFSCKLTKAQKSSEIHRVESGEETMQTKDALMFPVYGSFALLSLYIIYKFISKEYLTLVLGAYFSVIGLMALTYLLEFPLGKVVRADFLTTYLIKTELKIPFVQTPQAIEISRLRFLCISISFLPALIYVQSRNWFTNNIFGIAFSIVGISEINLPNFKIGFILLWGLFFYDIFWVYGTDVMLTVAKNIEAPIKLIFPYDWSQTPFKSNMLGLGDIVIPGIFVALCLKYDLDRRLKLASQKENSTTNVKTPIFNAALLGYLIGIVVTYAVMIIFQHGQPALLFLVPGVTGAVFLQSCLIGELKDVLTYVDKKILEIEDKAQPKTVKEEQTKATE